MGQLEDLMTRRNTVAANIEKACNTGFDLNEELEKSLGAGYDPNGEDGNVEKAHQVGDIHPNGKWVWTQLPSGKYDWRIIKKNKDASTDNGSSKKNVVDISKISDKEFKNITKILEKKNPEDYDAFRYLESEEMSDKELNNFIACAKHFKNDTKNINERTRKWCDKWEKLGEEELNSRKKENKKQVNESEQKK